MALLDRVYVSPRYFQPGTLNAYLLAAASVAAATALRMAVDGSIPGVQFITLFPAIIITTLICGMRAGAVAAVLAVLCAWFFILPPAYSLHLESYQYIYTLTSFTVVALANVGLVGLLRTAIGRVRRLNQNLTRANQTLLGVFEANPDAILLADGLGRITDLNPRTVELFGRSRAALLSAKLEDLMPERFRAAHSGHYAAYMAEPRTRAMGDGIELFALHGNGHEFPIDIQIGPIVIDGLTHSSAIVRDLTEHNRLRRALAESHQQQAVLMERQRGADELQMLANVFHHAAIGIAFSESKSATNARVNSFYAAAHGLTVEEAEARPIVEFYAEEDRPRLRALVDAIDRAGHGSFEARHVRADGTTFPVEMDITSIRNADGSVRYRIVTMRDTSERQQVEVALRQATKMEALGGLTGGMAHDFNNLLAVIILNLGFIGSRMPDTDQMKPLVSDALTAARSGADLIRGLLAFARRQALNPSNIDINELISPLHRLLSRTLGEDIELSLNLAPGLWPVLADASQVDVCILNLANNARDAMPNGGRLTITTENRRLDANYTRLNPSARPGDYVMIAVSDTGTGMTPEVMARAFEPFFTTKEVGQGTGLGLSMVFGFASQSGGHVSITSEAGSGTTVALFLPSTAELSAPAAAVEVAAQPAPGRGETILVAEDNEAVRRVVARQLLELGYRVVEAVSAQGALTLLEVEKIDLLFSDVVMPGGVGGFALAKQAHARWPALPVLLTSGFLNPIERRAADAETSLPLLGKPYDLEQLAQAVRSALGG